VFCGLLGPTRRDVGAGLLVSGRVTVSNFIGGRYLGWL
jgi:hypothetical protein